MLGQIPKRVDVMVLKRVNVTVHHTVVEQIQHGLVSGQRFALAGY